MYCYTETMIKEKKKENENEDLPAVTVVSMFAPRSRTAKIEMVLGFPPLQFVMVLNDNAMLSRSDLFFLSLVYFICLLPFYHTLTPSISVDTTIR